MPGGERRCEGRDDQTARPCGGILAWIVQRCEKENPAGTNMLVPAFRMWARLLRRVVPVDPARIMVERALCHRFDDFIDRMQAGQDRNQV